MRPRSSHRRIVDNDFCRGGSHVARGRGHLAIFVPGSADVYRTDTCLRLVCDGPCRVDHSDCGHRRVRFRQTQSEHRTAHEWHRVENWSEGLGTCLLSLKIIRL